MPHNWIWYRDAKCTYCGKVFSYPDFRTPPPTCYDAKCLKKHYLAGTEKFIISDNFMLNRYLTNL
jgi:hypothetical protein